MYVPAHFRVEDRAACHDLIAAHDFGLLVTTGADGAPFATHLPFLLQREEGQFGTLYAHMARANPQWRDFGEAQVLAVFAGPHAYVSPSWYESAPNVPTWNYAAVHAYGRPEILDAAQTTALLVALGAKHEGASGWRVEALPEAFRAGLQKGIVAFRVPIARLEGKWKMSQNKSNADRLGAAARLEASDDEAARETGRIMRTIK